MHSDAMLVATWLSELAHSDAVLWLAGKGGLSQVNLQGAMFSASTHDRTAQLLVEELVRAGSGGNHGSPRRQARSPGMSDSDASDLSDDEATKKRKAAASRMNRRKQEAKLKTMQCKFCLVRGAVGVLQLWRVAGAAADWWWLTRV